MSECGTLLCLAGRSGAGKDTAGAYLARRHAFQRVALADPIKKAMHALFGLTREQLWGGERDTLDPPRGRTPREMYQRFGGACVEIDPEVWIRPFRRRVSDMLRRGEAVVCTDLRTYTELQAAWEMGGAVWLIERCGACAPGGAAYDRTETELVGAPREHFDRVIRNDGTLADFRRRIASALSADRLSGR